MLIKDCNKALLLFVLAFSVFVTIISCKKVELERQLNVLNDTIYQENYNTIITRATIQDDGIGEFTYGHCFDTLPNPTINSQLSNPSDILGKNVFISKLENLETDKRYYVRAYIINSNQIVYSEPQEVHTSLSDLPEVIFLGYEKLDSLTIFLNGKLEKIGDGADSVLNYGHVWCTVEDPSLAENKTEFGSKTDTVSFTSEMYGLIPGNDYFVWTYAVNSGGVIYSDPLLLTIESGLPLVSVSTFNHTIDHNSVKISYVVDYFPYEGVLESGICYGKHMYPTISDSVLYVMGRNGIYTAVINDLLANTTYQIRVFARTEVGMVYSKNIEFTTKPPVAPKISLLSNSHICDGILLMKAWFDDGGCEVMNKGFCWSRNEEPKVTDQVLKITSIDKDTITLVYLLQPGQKGHIRAFVENDLDIAYSGELDIFRTKVDVDLVPVEGGSFEMGGYGESYDRPPHQVKQSNFLISRYEITNSQFCQFLNDRPIDSLGYLNENLVCDIQKNDQIKYYNNRFIVEHDFNNYPITFVSWYGAKNYCEWASGHLPTESQWEYAASGGVYHNPTEVNSINFAGDNWAGDVAWYDVNSNKKAHRVGTKLPNELGIYDLSGNVNEWNHDWFSEFYYEISPIENPLGPDDGQFKIMRGGSFNQDQDFGVIYRRQFHVPDSTFNNCGFRLVIDF